MNDKFDFENLAFSGGRPDREERKPAARSYGRGGYGERRNDERRSDRQGGRSFDGERRERSNYGERRERSNYGERRERNGYGDSRDRRDRNDDSRDHRPGDSRERQSRGGRTVYTFATPEQIASAPEDRPLQSDMIRQGGIAALKVQALTNIGAFLDWGLDKDLFLPFKEQLGNVFVGKMVVVGLYVDKAGRPCATMRLKSFMKKDPKFGVGQQVDCMVYEIRQGTGVLVVVEGEYFGLIPEQEWHGKIEIGEHMNARVVRIKEDGKIDLSPRKKAYKQIDDDAEMLLEMMLDNGGRLGFGEKASPEFIREMTGLSKASFKRAIGRLLRDAAVYEEDDDIFVNNK